jgi:DNA-binding XRE family transcriptional regulator
VHTQAGTLTSLKELTIAENPDGSRSRRRRNVPTGSSDGSTDEQLTVHVGHRLRQCRDSRGPTQAEAAEAAGITRNALGRLESKQFPNPSLQTLLALMIVYRLCSLEELLGPLPSDRLAKEWQDAGWVGRRQGSTPTK